jgi:hypothetical protein
MLIKYVILLINILFLLSSSVKANTSNYIIGNDQDKIVKKIDSFFTKHPNEERVIWLPEIKGKSRYAFSIPKNAYLTSKKYSDAADLYYLSGKNDEGLNFETNKSKIIDLSLLKDNFTATYEQRFLLDTSTGIFFEKKENAFGIILSKDFIISKNAMANFGFKQANNEYTVFDAKFVKLSSNEASEFYGNLNHQFKSDILNVGVEYTWFELAQKFDFTVALQEQDKKVESDIYVTFSDEKMKIELGLNKIKNNPNIFFNLKFEDILNKNKLRTNIIITSKDSFFDLRKLSLKNFRKKHLDMLWKKNINYN